MIGSSASTKREMVDTSVLVHAVDRQSEAKYRQAQALIRRLIDEDVLTVSPQVLSEFHAVVTRPRHAPPGIHVRAIQIVATLMEAATVLPVTASATLRALDAMAWHGLTFGDALLWATAREGSVSVVYSESFLDGRVIEGVQFANPFS
jgi:predicted nucleic acid-binding protein